MKTNTDTQSGLSEGIHSAVLVNIGANLNTSNGTASLYEALAEEVEDIVALWSDDAKPSPFLAGLSIGDTVRFHCQVREDEDENGRAVVKRYYTALPAPKG